MVEMGIHNHVGVLKIVNSEWEYVSDMFNL